LDGLAEFGEQLTIRDVNLEKRRLASELFNFSGDSFAFLLALPIRKNHVFHIGDDANDRSGAQAQFEGERISAALGLSRRNCYGLRAIWARDSFNAKEQMGLSRDRSLQRSGPDGGFKAGREGLTLINE
jgi:hypothetical protein